MDRLRQLISRINTQLSVLTVSQRLAIGLCAALVAGSLLWLLQWSTTPEMVQLVAHDFGFDELDAAEKALQAKGVPFETQGTRLYVRPADRYNALRLVHSAEALPEGSLFDMASVVADQNPFQAPKAREYAENYAKGNELAKIIATSPAVKKASVIINPTTKRRLGGVTDVPTASVAVTLGPGQEMTPEIVEGFAKLIAGAVAGLKPYNVYITDARTLRSYSVPHPEDAAGFDLLSMIKKREEHYRAKILSKLGDIPGVQVAVTVELDMNKRVTKNFKHDVPQPKMETSNATEQSAASQPTEPGVQPNMGQALTAAGSATGGSTEETVVENFEPKPSQTETIEQMPYATKKVNAAVGIPRSFIAGVFRARFPNVTETPKDDDPQLAAVRDEQIARVKAGVARIVMAKGPDDVEVDVYPDMEWTAEGGMWNRAPGGAVLAQSASGTEAFDTMDLVRTYAPQAGLVTLALMSLLMMMRIVRKSSLPSVGTTRRAGAGTEGREDEQILTVGLAPVGKAAISEGLLAGKEVDPKTLHYQELAQEVSRMVDEDPVGAAELLRRWMQNGK